MTSPNLLVDRLLALVHKPQDCSDISLRGSFVHLINEAFQQERAEARRQIEDAYKVERTSTMENAAALTRCAQFKLLEAKRLKAEALSQQVKPDDDTAPLTATDDKQPPAAACKCLGVTPGDPTPFDGATLSQDKVDDFVHGMECIFIFEPRLTELHKVILAVTKFDPTGAAAKWVRPYARLLKKGDDTTPEWIRSWSTFSAMLSSRFGESRNTETTMMELRELRQTGTARDYCIQFFLVMEQIELSEEAKKAMYKLNLNSDVRAALEGRNFTDLNDLIKASITVDEGLAQRRLPSTSVTQSLRAQVNEAAQFSAGASSRPVRAIRDTRVFTTVAHQQSAVAARRRLDIRSQEPHAFDGSTLSQQEVDDFVEGMENMFLLEPSLSEPQKVVAAFMKFKDDGAAANWLRPHMRRLKAGEPDAPEWLSTWSGFTTMLSHRFGQAETAEHSMLRLLDFVVFHQATTTKEYSMRLLHTGGETVTARRRGESLLPALIDSGSEADPVDERVVKLLQSPTLPLTIPRQLYSVNHTLADMCTRFATLNVNISGHEEEHSVVVARISQHLILGQPWLRRHDPTILHRLSILTFNSQTCLEESLRHPVPLQVPLLNANGQLAVACVQNIAQQTCQVTLSVSQCHVLVLMLISDEDEACVECAALSLCPTCIDRLHEAGAAKSEWSDTVLSSKEERCAAKIKK